MPQYSSSEISGLRLPSGFDAYGPDPSSAQSTCEWVHGLVDDIELILESGVNPDALRAIEQLFTNLLRVIHTCDFTSTPWIYSFATGAYTAFEAIHHFEEATQCSSLLPEDVITEMVGVYLPLAARSTFDHTRDCWWTFPLTLFDGTHTEPESGSEAFWSTIPFLLNHDKLPLRLQHCLIDRILSKPRTTVLDTVLADCAAQRHTHPVICERILKELLHDCKSLPIDSVRFANIVEILYRTLSCPSLDPLLVQESISFLLKVASHPQVDNYINATALKGVCEWLRQTPSPTHANLAQTYLPVVTRKLRLWSTLVTGRAIQSLCKPYGRDHEGTEWQHTVIKQTVSILLNNRYPPEVQECVIDSCLEWREDPTSIRYSIDILTHQVLSECVPIHLSERILEKLGPAYFFYQCSTHPCSPPTHTLSALGSKHVITHSRRLSAAYLRGLASYHQLVGSACQRNSKIAEWRNFHLRHPECLHLLKPV